MLLKAESSFTDKRCNWTVDQGGLTPIPVILSTFEAEGASLELGAEAFLGKPFDPDELVHNVRTLVHA